MYSKMKTESFTKNSCREQIKRLREEIEDRSICIDGDIGEVLNHV